MTKKRPCAHDRTGQAHMTELCLRQGNYVAIENSLSRQTWTGLAMIESSIAHNKARCAKASVHDWSTARTTGA